MKNVSYQTCCSKASTDFCHIWPLIKENFISKTNTLSLNIYAQRLVSLIQFEKYYIVRHEFMSVVASGGLSSAVA